jgi:hypothetical protein
MSFSTISSTSPLHKNNKKNTEIRDPGPNIRINNSTINEIEYTKLDNNYAKFELDSDDVYVPQYTCVSMEEFEVGMSPYMHLGLAVDTMMTQLDGYKMARWTSTRPPVQSQNTSPRNIDTIPLNIDDVCNIDTRNPDFIYNPGTGCFDFKDLDAEYIEGKSYMFIHLCMYACVYICIYIYMFYIQLFVFL